MPLGRLHKPATARSYRSLRSCLRWDFGFTCAICRLHESDFSPNGVEGLGLMAIEHFRSKSEAPALANEYSNLLYVCRLCNHSRGPLGQRNNGFALLNPTQEAWARHFVLKDDQLVPQGGDQDAEYTAHAYDVNDPRRVVMRKIRREQLSELLNVIADGPELLNTLLDRATRDTALIEIANALRVTLRRTVEQLSRFRAVPPDAPASCRCGVELELPGWFADAFIEVEDHELMRLKLGGGPGPGNGGEPLIPTDASRR